MMRGLADAVLGHRPAGKGRGLHLVHQTGAGDLAGTSARVRSLSVFLPPKTRAKNMKTHSTKPLPLRQAAQGTPPSNAVFGAYVVDFLLPTSHHNSPRPALHCNPITLLVLSGSLVPQ